MADLLGAAKPLFIYDGDCGVCAHVSGRLRIASSNSFDIAPYQTLELSKYGLTSYDCAAKAQLVIRYQVVWSGAQAVLYCARQGGGLLRLLGILGALPGIRYLSASLYWAFARSRKRIRWGAERCNLPS